MFAFRYWHLKNNHNNNNNNNNNNTNNNNNNGGKNLLGDEVEIKLEIKNS